LQLQDDKNDIVSQCQSTWQLQLKRIENPHWRKEKLLQILGFKKKIDLEIVLLK